MTRLFYRILCAQVIDLEVKEAGVGIEPTYGAFAEPGLTTWLPRRRKILPIHVDWRGDNRNLAPARERPLGLVQGIHDPVYEGNLQLADRNFNVDRRGKVTATLD